MFPRTWQDYYRNNNYSTVTLRCLTTGLECISFHNCIDCSNSGACFRESITATATGAKKKVENYGDRPPSGNEEMKPRQMYSVVSKKEKLIHLSEERIIRPGGHWFIRLLGISQSTKYQKTNATRSSNNSDQVQLCAWQTINFLRKRRV